MKLTILLQILSVLGPALTVANAADEEEYEGRSPYSYESYVCEGEKNTASPISLHFETKSKYSPAEDCKVGPSTIEVSRVQFSRRAGADEKISHVGKEFFSGESDFKASREKLLKIAAQELKKASVKGCQLVILAAAAANDPKLPPVDPENPEYPDQIGRTEWRFARDQRLTVLRVCYEPRNKKNAFSISERTENFSCRGTYTQSSASYWDNGCI